jgi:hypothetical protein
MERRRSRRAADHAHRRAGAVREIRARDLPRELLIEGVASELSDDEIDAQIIWLREQLAKSKEPLLIEAKAADENRVPAARE